jgi:hypothetical protein
LITGWADYRGVEWFQVENSHGARYSPMSKAVADEIPGYEPTGPTSTHDFWVDRRSLETVLGMPYSCAFTAAGVSGFKVREGLASLLAAYE